MNLENNETANDAYPEPIETSVVPLDAGMIIIQPVEVNQVDNDSGSNGNEHSINAENNQTGNEIEVTPSRKKRKR